MRVRAGAFADAETDFRRSLELAPDAPPPMNSLARLLAVERRSLDDAMRLAEAAFAADSSPSHRATWALALFQTGSRDSAIREAAQALRDAPRDADARSVYDYVSGAAGTISAAEALR